jgi:hypothetical protein
MLLHVMPVHFATLSFAFVVDREIVLVWGIILGKVVDFLKQIILPFLIKITSHLLSNTTTYSYKDATKFNNPSAGG